MTGISEATKITTPMSLAALALFLMLGTGLLKTVSKVRKPSPLLIQSIRWGFIIALVFGILANISFLATSNFNREIRLSGTIRDADGNPISMAIADLGGKKGRGITDNYGEFELNVPIGRAVTEYRLFVSADGFVSTNFSVKGPNPNQIEITLHHPIYAPEDFVSLESNASVRHYLGNPDVVLWLDFTNPFSHRMTLENLKLSLVSPNGKTTSLGLEGTYFGPGSQMFPTYIIPLEKSPSVTLGCSFCNADQSLLGELTKTQIEAPLIDKLPNPQAHIYSDALTTELKAFMNNKMIWAAGTWNCQLNWSAEGKSYKKAFHFSLADDDISRMNAISKYYAAGYGVYPPINFYAVGDANPTTAVIIQQ